MSPRFAPGVRLQHDRVRDRWVVMAPERMIVPDAIALEVLRLIDGTLDEAAIIDALAARFAAPRSEIAADVQELLDELAAKGVLHR